MISRTLSSLPLLVVFLAELALSQTAEEKALYPDWSKVMKEQGYMWEPHTVVTEDGWYLTLFRITGRNGKLTTPDPLKYPILVQHGAFDDGLKMVDRGLKRWPTLPLQLANRGYDVWIGNNRGT